MSYSITEIEDHEEVGFICRSCRKFMELVGQVTVGDHPRCDRCGGDTDGPRVVLKGYTLPKPKPDTCPM